MGAKKKVQIHNEKEAKHPSVVSNKLRTLRTSDGASFQLNDVLLSKFSGKLRRKIEQFKGEQILQVQDADRVTFKFIEQFLSSRKDKQMSPIHFPMRSNISLKYIMDQSDALLMDRIQTEGGMELVHRLLQAATALQMQDLRKRLFCLVALKLSKHTIDQLKDFYMIPDIDSNQDVLKSEMKGHLEVLKKNHDKKSQEQ